MINSVKRDFKVVCRKTKVRRLKIKVILCILLILLGAFFYFSELHIKKSNELRVNIYNSMKSNSNRKKAYDRAVALNGGNSINTCVYFVSEVLRINRVYIDDSICNTSQLLDKLKKEGWKVEKDYKKLKPGDICFTTDESLNKNGIPTHTYIFMGWEKEGSYDYAYICDNQAKDYGGKFYHLRNITKVDKVKGNTKEPFNFFLYK